MTRLRCRRRRAGAGDLREGVVRVEKRDGSVLGGDVRLPESIRRIRLPVPQSPAGVHRSRERDAPLPDRKDGPGGGATAGLGAACGSRPLGPGRAPHRGDFLRRAAANGDLPGARDGAVRPPGRRAHRDPRPCDGLGRGRPSPLAQPVPGAFPSHGDAQRPGGVPPAPCHTDRRRADRPAGGEKGVAPEAVRKVMATRIGEELDLGKVREDVKAIYRMGYFRDVTFDAEEVEGGYRLTVIVAEKPIVAAVQIEGNKDVEGADLRAAVTIKERSLYQEEKVKESISKLVEVCQNKGYIDASVDASVSEDVEGGIRVIFRVAEGPKLGIERISIAGNLFHSTKAIRKAMDTSEKGLFSFITDSGTFKKDVLENDVRKIEALYQNSGFLDSKIFEPEVGRGKKGLIITIRVYEGRQYRVGEIRFAGESGIPEETLRNTVKIAQGDLFHRETLLSDLLALTTLMNDDGYAQALVSPGVEKRKEYPVADVTFRFERGTKFRFGKVEISGNTKTMDRVVRRNIDVSDGQTYTATGLKTSKENLTRTSYFKDVKISTAPSAVPGEMDAKIEVQEGPTGTLWGGLGYSSLDKIFGVVQLTENNLFGRGWKASLNSQFGARRTTYSIDFRDPHFLDTDFSLLLGLYKTKVQYNDFEKDARGGRVGVGYNFSRFISGSVSLRADATRILPVDSVLPTSALREEFAKGLQHTRSLTFSMNRNSTDKFIDPSRGSVQSGSVEYAGGPLGGDSQFVKYFL